MPAIKLNQVSFNYGLRPILREVTFTLNGPLVVGIVGRSGSGKTTLLKLLAGILAPSAGSIDTDIGRASWVPQDAGLFPWLTVSENIGFPLTLRRQFLPPSERRRLTEGLCRQLRLSEAADRLPITASGGEKQRAAIGRALASSSNLLLLDEPFASLDPAARMELRHILRNVVADNNMITAFASHDLIDVCTICDVAWVISDCEQRVLEVDFPSLGPRSLREQGAAGQMAERLLLALGSGAVEACGTN